MRTRAAQQQQAGIVPIGVLHYCLSLLDTLAVAHNLLSQPDGDGGALYDVAGRTQSPYLTRETLVAAALAASAPAGTVQFQFPTSLRFDNTGNAVQSLTLDFNDGSAPATLLPGGPGVSRFYGTAGEYFIRLTAHFADGSSKATFTSLRITGQSAVANKGVLARNADPNFPPISPCDPSDTGVPLTASISYSDYEGNTYTGFGKVTTYFANCSNRQLTKPVIMLDGIDFGGPAQRVGIDVYSDFLNYYDQGVPKRLGEELRAAGNDLIILDFPDANGAEYIQRNAFVLIQLIQNVNAALRSRGSVEQLTVIGPSMSGLVSRYALAYMEKKYNDANDPTTYRKPEWNHNTRLWISYDSPQLGANVPIGDQQWLQYYSEVGEVEAAKANLANLDRPASREMLVHHYRSPVRTVSGAPGFRDRFQAELDDLGMPVQPRRIAVVNGSLAGVKQDWLDNSRKANGCDQAFRFQAKTGKIRLFYIKFLPITPLFPTILSNSRVNFSPDYGGTCITFIGEIFTKSNRGRIATGRPNSISYDVAPGSWRDTQGTLAKEGTVTNARIDGFLTNVFLGGLSRPSQTTRFYDVVEKHCFIPTVSALALTNSNRDLGQNLSTTDLVCSGETPFDSYFAPLQNEEHVTITANNAAYVKQEIGRIMPIPIFTAAPTAICPGGSVTFSVKAECARAGQPTTVYDWTLSGSAVFAATGTQTLSGAGNSQVVSATSATGMVTLTVVARRAGAAASTTVTKYIHITDAYSSATAPGEVAKFETFTAVLDQENTTGPYTWSISPSFKASILNASTANGPSIRVRANNAGQITITATGGINACTGAVLPATSTIVTITTGGLRPAESQSVAYPNPADAVLHLAAPEPTEAAVTARTAVLYNAQGREVRRSTARQDTQLSTADLPTGLYYLVVEQDGRVSRSQIRVQH